MDAVMAHGVVDHAVKAPERRSISFADEKDKFVVLSTQGADEDEERVEDDDKDAYNDEEPSEDAEDGNEEVEEEEEEEEEGQAAYEPFTPSRPSRRVQFCDEYGEEEPVRSPSSPHPRVTAASAASSRSPRSPLLKKFSPLQDRRVNAILIEALQLVDFSSTELAVIDKAVKRLRDAIHGFALLVDKQVNIIGGESLEERGRVRADIMDLCEGLRNSNALIESTCLRMKKTLGAGKNQIHAHKRKLMGRAVKDIVSASSPSRAGSGSSTTDRLSASSPSAAAPRVPSSPYALRFNVPISPIPLSPKKKSPLKSPPLFSTSKSPTRVPFASLLRGGCSPEDLTGASDSYGQTNVSLSPLLPPKAFVSVLESVGLAESEFLDQKAVTRVMHEALAVLIARSSSLTFLGKAHHRKLLPQYASELARLVLFDLHVLPQATPSSPVVILANTLFDYMTAAPFRFDALVNILRVSNASAGGRSSSPSSLPASPTKSASPFFRAPAFMTPAAAAATDTFGVNPFAEQLTRNGGIVNGGQVVSLVVGRPTEPERLESAEQTLAMARLLHELATAECEARAGNRLSLRAPDTRAKEFSRAYLAASKQLLEQEASGGFA